MSKVSIQSQIAAVEAAADGKASTYRGAQKELHIDHLRAAAQSLRFVRRHEAEIRKAVGNGAIEPATGKAGAS